MAIALYVFAAFLAFGFLAIGALWLLGRRQPSQKVSLNKRVLFVALKRPANTEAISDTSFAKAALWRGRAAYAFIGEPELYWTDYFLLPPDPALIAGLDSGEGYDDAFVAEVELVRLPAPLLGFLRAQFRLGLNALPKAPLPVSDADIPGRRDVMPTMASVEATRAMAPATPITMMNFLEYFPDEAGDKAAGRRTYNRYGAQAMRAVHQVGGQFLFAGKIVDVIIPSQAETAPVPWDDLAAMIYPDPAAIFGMEQSEAYVAAFEHRDASLKRSDVIATVAD